MPVFTGGGALVTSASIVDGAIIDADINAAATIALTKLAGSDASGFNESIIDQRNSRFLEVAITSTDILNMTTAAGPTIVPAPGAGKAVVVWGYTLSYIFNTIAYNTGQNMGLYYGTGGVITGAGQMSQTVIQSGASNLVKIGNDNGTTFVPVANTAVLLRLVSGTSFLLGNGTAKLIVHYSIMNV